MNKSGFVIVKEGGKAGLKNKDGKMILPCVYDRIPDYDDDGYIRVIIGDVCGTVDLEGNEVIPHSKKLTHLGVFHDGTARAKRGKGWGLVDEKGEVVVGFNYRRIDAFSDNGYNVVNPFGVEGFLSPSGKFTPSATPSDNEQFNMADVKSWSVAESGVTRFYYRDTDLSFDVEETYIPGTILRAGEYLVMTDKLLRPVHNTRFVIVSNHMLNVDDIAMQYDIQLPFKGCFLHYNSCFLVLDLIKISGVRQVLLLHIPQRAVSLAKETSRTKEMTDYLIENCHFISDMARNNLSRKLGKQVHGYSLLADWQNIMSRPVGLDENNHLFPLEPASKEHSTSDFKMPNTLDYLMSVSVGAIGMAMS